MSAQPDAPAVPSLTLKRRIKASPATLFRAWTEPQAIAQWFGPDGAVTEHASFDVRAGGRFSIKMHTPGESHAVSGVYREVVPDAKLVFTWAWQSTPERESLITITLKPDGAETILTLLHERFFNQAAHDGHARGWNEGLDKLAALYGS
jgi:uncharacterized protein YndB with AHSA1/START domain